MGNLHIRHIWQLQTDTIIDVKVMGKDKKYYIFHTLENVAHTKQFVRSHGLKV